MLKNYFVVFRNEEGKLNGVKFNDEFEFKAKEKALNFSKKLTKKGIASVVSKEVNKDAISLLSYSEKNFKRFNSDIKLQKDEFQKEDEFWDSEKANRAAERYCRQFA